MSTATVTLLVLSPFAAWRIYSRFRRSVGKQKMSVFFQRTTLCVFAGVTLLLAYFSLGQLDSLAGLGAGLLIGVLLGLYGLRSTRFESTPEGLYYHPNAPLGIALSVLFVGRIVWRIVQFSAIESDPGHAHFARSPLTVGVFGLLAGYYIAYAIGLLRKGSATSALPSPDPAQPTGA
jgi:Na+/proline symporter